MIYYTRDLQLAREIIAKPRPMLITRSDMVMEGYIKRIRDQLRKEILEEFDKTFSIEEA